MFVLRTGLMGNGKTLNTIKELDKKAKAENRVVYYHNITEFNPNHEAIEAEWVEFDDPEKWYELPQNAIIVIDEAQKFFRVRPQGSKVPLYASEIETMRKSGHELHCITQNPSLIDTHFRKLCNTHIHYVRGHKGPIIKRWEFEQVALDVDKKKEFPDGQSTRITIAKEYFGCYKSVQEGTNHHFKFKPPRALFVFIGCLLLIAILSYKFYKSRIAPTEQQPAPEVISSPTQPSAVVGTVQAKTIEEYVQERIPRVPDMPESAPMYDQLTQAVSYPKTFCISTHDQDLLERQGSKMILGYHNGRLQGCRCNTQQGTRVEISFDACIARVENGAFDPAKPDKVSLPQQAVGAVGPSESRAGTTVQTAQVVKDMQVTVIPDGSYSSRPWRGN